MEPLPDASKACLRCGARLSVLLLTGGEPDGYACLTCKLYYPDTLEPVELWRKLWAMPERAGQSVTFVDYTQGIEHPQFWALCPRCRNRHGPYDKLAAIPNVCAACSEQDATQLKDYLQHREK